MRGWILYVRDEYTINRNRDYNIYRLMEEAVNNGVQMKVVTPGSVVIDNKSAKAGLILVGDTYVPIPEFVIVRTFWDAYLCEALLSRLETLGVNVINPVYTIRETRDKFLQYNGLTKIGVPCAKMLVVSNQTNLQEISSLLEYPVLIRNVVTWFRGGLIRADNPQQLIETIDFLFYNNNDKVYLLEEYKDTDHYYRVDIAGKEAVSNLKITGDYRKVENYEKHEINDTLISYTEDIINEFGLELGSIEYYKYGDTYSVKSIQSIAEFQRMESATSINMADRIIKYAKKATTER